MTVYRPPRHPPTTAATVSVDPSPPTTSGPVRVDWGKLLILLSGIGATVTLTLTGHFPNDVAIGVVGTVIGYVTGNGRLVAARLQPAPMLHRPGDPNTTTVTTTATTPGD